MMRFDNCCMGCIERHIGCHSSCSKYVQAKQEHDKRKAVIDAHKRTQHDINASHRYEHPKQL